MTYRIGALAVLAMMAVMSGVLAAEAQERPGVTTAATQDSGSTGGVAQGIKIHGHWVIEVRNSDGSLASRHEFDNALSPAGAVQLARFLGRDGVPTRWVIQLGRYSMTGPCQGATYNGSTLHECFIVDPQSTPLPTGTAVFPNLTTAIGGPTGNQVVLTGHATALVAGHIEYVATRLGACLSSTLIANCNSAGGANYFTVHDLVNQGQPAPLSIAAGQIVQVTVVISFS